MIEVRVPASSANMGPGYDSFGVALAIYNTIRVSEIENGVFIKNISPSGYIPVNENNLIYRSIIRAFDEVGYKKRGLKISQKSDIPMTRGLGSSSACIVGGLMAANLISGKKLTSQRIFELADEIEGHPDNVGPALFGGFCISLRDEKKLFHQSIRLRNNIKFVAMVPTYYLVTRKSRGLIPDKIPIKDASFNISCASLIALSLASGDYRNLSLYCKDRLHQPYRKTVVNDLDEVVNASISNGALAAYLSGSGPTVVAMIDSDNVNFLENMNKYFINNDIKRECMLLECDNVGAIAKWINV